MTRYLQEWRAGDDGALARLATEVYRELHRLSRAILSPHQPNTILQPTVLLHELYLQLPGVRDIDWQSRAQFFNTAARMMRNILVDYARSQRAQRRGGSAVTISLTADLAGRSAYLDILMVHELLDRFAGNYPRQARALELRFFGGLTAEETVEVFRSEGLEYSLRTAERDWSFAKAWLHKHVESV